jgi:hypothetical protein
LSRFYSFGTKAAVADCINYLSVIWQQAFFTLWKSPWAANIFSGQLTLMNEVVLAVNTSLFQMNEMYSRDFWLQAPDTLSQAATL